MLGTFTYQTSADIIVVFDYIIVKPATWEPQFSQVFPGLMKSCMFWQERLFYVLSHARIKVKNTMSDKYFLSWNSAPCSVGFFFFLCVHSSTQCWIVRHSPVEWQIEWTSDLDLAMSIVYSTGSSRVQLFNAVPASYRAMGVQTAVPVCCWLHQTWERAFVMKEFPLNCCCLRIFCYARSFSIHLHPSHCKCCK